MRQRRTRRGEVELMLKGVFPALITPFLEDESLDGGDKEEH